MMLTLKQPVHYGYRPVHDLPTPPRSSPPLTAQDSLQKLNQNFPPQRTPSGQPMSAPHRGLPPPAAMALPQPPPPLPPPSAHAHPPAPGAPLHSQGPPARSPHSQSLGSLPVPPPHWQGSEESMRNWLVAKTEEERRRQEEEKTRQETLRLEQRRIEHDMLRTSLDRGVPPQMVPIMFAGMSGGALPNAALEWIQQHSPSQQGPHSQTLTVQRPLSPENRRDSQQYAPYATSGSGVPTTPGSGPSGHTGHAHYQGPGSPPRPRIHTLSLNSSVGRQLGGSALPRLSTGESAPAHIAHAHGQQPTAPPQQESQSPSIYFHHWQPPSSQAGSHQPATPSVDSPRKRKATGPQQAAPAPTSQMRLRSPQYGQQSSSSALANQTTATQRRGHSRQQSDASSYRPAGRGRGETFGLHGGLSPGLDMSRAPIAESSRQPRSSGHSVSTLLSDQPSARYASGTASRQGESERQVSPSAPEERRRS